MAEVKRSGAGRGRERGREIKVGAGLHVRMGGGAEGSRGTKGGEMKGGQTSMQDGGEGRHAV